MAKSTQSIYIGTVSGNAVVIKTYWSGSVGGIYALTVGGANTPFLNQASLKIAGGTATLSTTGTANLDVGTELEQPDTCLADCYQTSTLYTSPGLTDTTVGVVPFKFVASNGAPTGLTNVTPQIANALFGTGNIRLSQFTSANADEGTTVFAVGRDPDSGTRITALSETGVGALGNIVQYLPTISGGAVTGTASASLADGTPGASGESYTYSPAATLYNGITVPVSYGGYSSGGSLATAMGSTTNATTGYSVTYLSTGDAATAIGLGAKELTYNGVLYSAIAVAEGQYTFWGYEHVMYKGTLDHTTTNVKYPTVQALIANLTSTTATVKLSTMHVSRTGDGALVGP